MFERFTHPARRAVLAAQEHARRLGHDQVQAEHLLLGVLDTPDDRSVAALLALGLDRAALDADLCSGASDEEALRSIGVDLAAVRSSAEAQFGAGALNPRPRHRRGLLRRAPRPDRHLRLTASAKDALEQSLRQAMTLQHRYIGTEHLLLGLLATDHAPAARTLQRVGVAPDDARAAVLAGLRRAPAA